MDMNARQKDGYRDLKAFLKLLAAVLRGGVTDAEPAAEQEVVQVRGFLRYVYNVSFEPSLFISNVSVVCAYFSLSQAVTGGLQAVLPLLPADLPAHPKLCMGLFDILAYTFETFPGAVAALPPGEWAGLAGTLFHGLGFPAPDRALTQVLLEAAAALAGYHAQVALSQESNQPTAGAPGNLVGCADWAVPGLTPLGTLASRLLQRLVLIERGAGVVAVAAPALLPLLITEGAGPVESVQAELVKLVNEPDLQVW